MTFCTVQSCFALNESPTLSSCATSSSSKHCRSMVTILWECTRRIASLGDKSGKETAMKPPNVWKLDHNKMIINPGAVEYSRSAASSACSPANPRDKFPRLLHHYKHGNSNQDKLHSGICGWWRTASPFLHFMDKDAVVTQRQNKNHTCVTQSPILIAMFSGGTDNEKHIRTGWFLCLLRRSESWCLS